MNKVNAYSLPGLPAYEPMKLDIETIAKVVSEFYDIPLCLVRKKTRKREVVECRQVICYLCRIYTSSSLRSIGLYVGGKDHTTVIHSRDNIKDLIDTNNPVKDKIDTITKSLENERTSAEALTRLLEKSRREAKA